MISRCSQEKSPQLTFWSIDKQQVTVDFDGGRIVSDAGLLPLRDFERKLGVIRELAQLFPDPRNQLFVTHTVENILTQEVYQFLAGYFDSNDAQVVRDDPLFQTLVGISPDQEDGELASGSTLSRFQYSYTRRQRKRPPEERPAFFEQRQSQIDRVHVLNNYFRDLFIRTRRKPPAHVIIDLDATDDPTYGQQVLSFYHGYYRQKQYFPLLAFDGETGFPLAAWLRPGTVHAACGAVDTLQEIVQQLRQAWPNVAIFVRGDAGYGVPEMYEFCEREGLFYAFGYGANATLKRRNEQLLTETVDEFEKQGEPLQRFLSIDDYQAGSWSQPRRVLAKVEVNGNGTNRRFVVTNMSGAAQGLYHGFYVKRGNVPERPIGELKNSLGADRLSSHGFTANAMRLGLHVLAYAIFVLFREATVDVPEVASAELGTVRTKLFKVGAVVRTSVRRIWFHLSETWPHRDLLLRVQAALDKFAQALGRERTAVPNATPSTPF